MLRVSRPARLGGASAHRQCILRGYLSAQEPALAAHPAFRVELHGRAVDTPPMTDPRWMSTSPPLKPTCGAVLFAALLAACAGPAETLASNAAASPPQEAQPMSAPTNPHETLVNKVLRDAADRSGLPADQLQVLLRSGAERPWTLRVFAFALPALYFLAYFIGMMNTEGLRWSIHVWSGPVGLAGLVGLLLPYLLLPPPLPEASAAAPPHPR